MPGAFMSVMASRAAAGGPVDEMAPNASFAELFERERQPLFSAVWLVTRDRHEAEEIVQEAFVRVLERWDRVGTMDDPAGYLYRTAMNVWRSRRRRAAVAFRRVVHAVPVDGGLGEVESRDAALRMLAELTPRERAAVVLVDLVGMSSEQAATALGIRSSTVRVLLARGRQTLRGRMER